MDRLRVDYDSLSSTYHSRYDERRLDGIEHALLELVGRYLRPRVLEVGCGTGKWIESLRDAGVSVFGVDASFGMLAHAGERLGSEGFAAAQANDLPFAGELFDIIFSVNAIHHFEVAERAPQRHHHQNENRPQNTR